MRTLLLSALLTTAACLPAQNTFYVPDNLSNAGTCNVFPLGQTYMRYQTIVTPQDLGNSSGLIQDLGFAPCGGGTRTFQQITVKMDHITASTLSPTFATNITANAVTVLNGANLTWNMVAGTWSKLGLTTPFAYNGTDHLLIEIEVTGGTGSSGACHRGTRSRIFSKATGAATGSVGNYGLKMELSMSGGAGTYGKGCQGSNGVPQIFFTGEARLGKTLDANLASGPVSSGAFLNIGFTNSAPYPFDLTPFGATGCMLYSDPFSSVTTASNGTGDAQISIPIGSSPGLVGLKVYFQWLCLDPPGNTLGFTTSNGGVAVVGK